MAQAGLTHGGFYAHFESKEELVREAMEAAFDASRLKYDAGLEALIRSYLRPAHRDNPGRGCALATLGPEIARRKQTTRAAFSRRLETFVERIESQLPESIAAPDAQAIAIGILGVMIGTLQMSRTVANGELSEKILESGITAALLLAGVVKKAT
jgi:TetR/AcrR family transcriptional repressor of nem operon